MKNSSKSSKLKIMLYIYIRMPNEATKRKLESVIAAQIKKGLVPTGALLRFIQDEGLTGLVEDTSHQLITVALPNDYSLQKIKEYIESPHQWVRGGLLSVERYSKTGVNLHIHILITGYRSKTLIIRDLSRKFKIETNFIDVQRGKTATDYNNRIQYLKGNKMDTEKIDNVQKDDEWRHKEGFNKYYRIKI
ncbi:MAG: putative replication initiation protein [Circoviridae sp.]|nr:MAG: putative replication initiation protein [Circoviridae sp.]